jgi:hypothetical protein
LRIWRWQNMDGARLEDDLRRPAGGRLPGDAVAEPENPAVGEYDHGDD